MVAILFENFGNACFYKPKPEVCYFLASVLPEKSWTLYHKSL